ncbi:hypothetical protein CAPTEDRAFT_192338 [Capitella teleta]|uniref:Uncharacterized protein n=1 Tax=Capitella teleta TaxID=283909 RepID=R7UBM0_CAPTE|nr:hypothetical protein CAPTEDRAFT_192338 [Capitella teleta]|eukprot:ELU03770.1 hypothetical protein CAPTEDRAFT_192338 [Capitella teleta]
MVCVLNVLLEQCEAGFVSEEDVFGSTPLHYAVFANSVDAAKLLLDEKCKRDHKKCKGRTAGELATILGYGDMVLLLSGKDRCWKSDIFNCKDGGKIESSERMGYKEFTDELIKQDRYDGLDLSPTEYEEVLLLKSLPSAAIDAFRYVLGKAFGSAHFKWGGKH